MRDGMQGGLKKQPRAGGSFSMNKHFATEIRRPKPITDGSSPLKLPGAQPMTSPFQENRASGAGSMTLNRLGGG